MDVFLFDVFFMIEKGTVDYEMMMDTTASSTCWSALASFFSGEQKTHHHQNTDVARNSVTIQKNRCLILPYVAISDHTGLPGVLIAFMG
jgi:hypothetical protein